MFRRLVILGISAYQKFLSPYKGFCCAHHYVYGRATCSQAVKRIIKKHGVLGGRVLVRRRFQSCRHAYLKLQQDDDRKKRRKDDDKNRWSDVCDPSIACDGCGGNKSCDLPLPDTILPCDCSL